jgi:FKBP-type peptidyl-prolyl cis-trans isomerase FklB
MSKGHIVAASAAGAIFYGAVSGLAAPPSPATPPSAPAAPAVTAEVGSYDIGLMFGSQLANNGLGSALSRKALVRGLEEALSGKAVSAEQRNSAQQFTRDAREALAARNNHLARKFLEKNLRQDGVKTLASGLQYRVLAEGDPTGRAPDAADQVRVRYRASLADGTVIDRSEDHSQPAVFRMNYVIKGWREALSAMRSGAKWEVYVPPELGYGDNSPPPIPPGALIVYELELLRIEPAREMPAQPSSPHEPAGAP